MPYEQIQSDLLAEEERRKRVREALLQNRLDPMQSAGGRAIPISPFQALSTGLQRYAGQEDIRASETESERLMGAQETERKAAVDALMQKAIGGKETSHDYPRFEGEEPISGLSDVSEPDMRGALLESVGSPYTEKYTPVMQALMKADTAGSGTTPYKTPVYLDDGSIGTFDNRTGEITKTGFSGARYDPDALRKAAEAKAGGAVTGADVAEQEIALPKAEYSANETVRLVDDLIAHPGFKDVIGLPDNPLAMKGLVWGTDAAGARNLLSQLEGRTFMEIFPTLKGGGQITEIEGEKGQAAINRMTANISETEFIKAAEDFKNEITKLKEVVRVRAGGTPQLAPDVGDIKQVPTGWDAEDYKYLTDDEKREAHGG